MAILDEFALDADITLSELREEGTLRERLLAHHRLRLRRRNDVLGVIVDADEWRILTQYVRMLEQRIEHYEDQVARVLISERASRAVFVAATPAVIEDIEREYQALMTDE